MKARVEERYEFVAEMKKERFYNEDSCWGCFVCITEDDVPYKEKKKYKYIDEDDVNVIVVTGKMPRLEKGVKYKMACTAEKHEKYGWSYITDTVYGLKPSDISDKMVFLTTIVSEDIAKNILDVYPNIIEDIKNKNTDHIDVKKIHGVGEKRLKTIIDKVNNSYAISELITLLAPHGVTGKAIRKISDHFKSPDIAAQKIKKNPYCLVDITGFGFKKVDIIALKIRPDLRSSQFRTIEYLKYALDDTANSDGNTWIRINTLRNRISNDIPECMDYFETCIENEILFKTRNDKIGLVKYFKGEYEVLERLIRKSKEPYNRFDDDYIEYIIGRAEYKQGFTYSEEQREAIIATLKRPLSIITGKAGVGKTSIMNAILMAYERKDYIISSCALSAMASHRISEATGYPASTIHRLLQYTGEFGKNEEEPIESHVLLVDECSMISVDLFKYLLRAVPDGCAVILSGDAKQLPPIGAGNVFGDVLELLNESVISSLKTPMRQAMKSGILSDANLVRDNINPLANDILANHITHGEKKDMHYLIREDKDSLFNMAIRTYLNAINDDGIENVSIVVPRNRNVTNSTEKFNVAIQDYLLGKVPQVFRYQDKTFKLGARVMQTTNNYDKNVFNGEIGTIVSIYYDKDEEKHICEVEYKDLINSTDDEDVTKTIKYLEDDDDGLDLAYALTTHKIQGGARKSIIAVTDVSHYTLLDNTMLYTILTRAKTRCALFTDLKGFQQCISKTKSVRDTWLRDMIYDGSFDDFAKNIKYVPTKHLIGNNEKRTTIENARFYDDTAW